MGFYSRLASLLVSLSHLFLLLTQRINKYFIGPSQNALLRTAFLLKEKVNNNNKKKTSKKKPLWFKIHKNCLQSIYNLLLFILSRKNLMFQNRYLSAARCIKRKRTGHLHSNHGYHGLIQIITCFLRTAISTGQLRENYLLNSFVF